MSDSSKPVSISQDALTNAIATGVQLAIQETRPKEFNLAEHILRDRDPALDLKRPVYQHGQPIQIRGCSQDTIKHLNDLKPGKYINGMVTVTVKGEPPYEAVYIDHPLADKDARLRFYMMVSSFSDMLQKISKEQKERDGKQQ